MNKAVTDGLALMPPAFEDGLDVWSAGDGTPGSDTYAGSGSGAFVPADQDFGGCLEILASADPTKLRYMGQTPILPGCYLEVRARVKAVSGPLPAVRIAGWAGDQNGHVTGLIEAAPAVQLTGYGQVVELRAIIGTGARQGVDLVWQGVDYGHIGIDVLGGGGAAVRVDDLTITDVTGYFLRDMMGVVDVRDYGAAGDGVTDDSAAFEAADADANGREVLVSAGQYYLGQDVTLDNQVHFVGTVIQPADRHLILRKNFDFVTYADAFGDEEQAFKKAFQALLAFSDHESLDLNGRRISLSAPVDMQAATPDKVSYATRRVIRNGQLEPVDGPAWDPLVVTSQATYSAAAPLTLSSVSNAAAVPVGALVTGNGVGREIYVRAVDPVAQTVTLSRALYDAEGVQIFTFTRFRYLVDFTGFDALSQFCFEDVEFQCKGVASGIMLAPDGLTFNLRDCFMTKPRDRGLTSIGTGCQGMLIDRCQFLSDEQALPVSQRTSIGFNVNGNDVKIRDSRVVRFRHFCIMGGTGHLITGNHWFHGDDEVDGVRLGGIVLTTPNCKSVVTGNYIDNNYIEWTNEHEADPALGVQYSFGGLTVTGNIFTANDVAPWFNWIVIKPYGPDHYIHGLSVLSNVFRALNGNVVRVEKVDTTFADLNYTRMRNVTFAGNTFNAVDEPAINPVPLEHSQTATAQTWVVQAAPYLPFGGRARVVEAVTAQGKISDGSGAALYAAPYAKTAQGAANDEVHLVWPAPCRGDVRVVARCDQPL